MKNKTIYFAIIFVLFVSLGIFGLQKDNIAKAETITFQGDSYTANFNIYLNGSKYSRGETASASIEIYIEKITSYNSLDVFSGTVTIAGKEYYLFSYEPVYSLESYYQISAPVETTSGDYNATFTIDRNGGQDTQQVTIPYNVYALTNWSSSDPSIVTVDNNGYAEAKAPGTAKITVTYKDKVAYLNIVIYPAHIVLAPTAFTFTGISGGATPAGQTLNIKNTGGATLGWSGVTSQGWCHISAGSGSLAADASQNITVTVDPPSNVGSFNCAISISDPNADNSPQTASATYTVSPSPPGDFSLSLSGGSAACNSVPLSWTSSSGADAYKILRGSPRVDISPYQPYIALNFTDTTVSQNTSYQYQIEASNAVGTKRSNEISVTTPYCPPTINPFSASPTSIYQGQSTTLSWATYYTTSCTASGAWSGSKALSGSQVVVPLPPPSVTYTLSCSGPGGSVSQSVTINISLLGLPNWREIIPR